MERVSVDVQRPCDAGHAPDDGTIAALIGDVIDATGEPGRHYEVSVRLVDEAESRDLNARYRDRDRPTNVLSFAAYDDPVPLPDDANVPLGDVVVCVPLVAQAADEQQKTVRDHWAHLVVHGTLHLLGYDHESDEDAAVMEALETRLLAERGVPDPYAAL